MPELILRSLVNSITRHAVSLISQETVLASGVTGELERLRDTVSAIGAILPEAEKRQLEAEDVRVWLVKLKDAVYDADDLLEDYSTEVQRRRSMGEGCELILEAVRIFFSSSNPLIHGIKMAHRVKGIRERLEGIANDWSKYKVEGSRSLGSLVEDRIVRETYPFESHPYVIGRDEDKKEVIKFLLNPDSEENISILAIVGSGGMGKTTLSRLVFNDESVKEHFELMLWVCVSNNFNVEDIVKKIIRECGGDRGVGDLDTDELQEALRVELSGKRFLLVVDNMWNDNRRTWLDFEGFLRKGRARK